MKKVGILVVTYNRLELLKEEIKSLRNQVYKDFDILIVNNGSTDGTEDWLKQQEDLLYITQENLGGAGGFFTGIKFFAEQGYEYCWLMDDDVECSANALKCLVDVAEREEEIGFLCSRVFGTDGNLMNVPEVDDRQKNGSYSSWMKRIDDKMIQVKSATFVSILFPLKHAFELGLPIKEYFIWGDDMEYTQRISEKYDSYLVWDSKVIHKRKQQEVLNFMTEKSSQRLKNYYYQLRNTICNRRKYEKKKSVVIEYIYQLNLFVKSLLKLDFYRMRLLLRVYKSYFFFSPKIEYPNKKTI